MSKHSHPFLTDEQHGDLRKFAKICKQEGKMECLSDDAEIMILMAMNGLPKPVPEPGNNHRIYIFSDQLWSYLVVLFSGFTDEGGNGLAALKINREYLMKVFMPSAVYSEERARKMFNGFLCILQVDPRQVEFDKLNFNSFEPKRN